jgi:hypothetical protein
MTKPLVQNAADEQQVKEAKKKEKFTRESELADLKTVLETAAGQRLLWRVLEKCGTFESTYSDIPHRMAYHAGRQDVGHFVLAEITQARGTALMEMMQRAQEARNA